MLYSEDLKNAAKVLGKEGKAFVTISLVPYANDLDFREDPPSCRVTVTARDPLFEDKTIEIQSADIPTTQAPYKHVFEIKVQTTIKSLGRFFGFTQHRALSIDVKAEPIGGYEKWYEANASINDLSVEAGNIVEKNVSLKPKYEGSRLEQLHPRQPEA